MHIIYIYIYISTHHIVITLGYVYCNVCKGNIYHFTIWPNEISLNDFLSEWNTGAIYMHM